ncbi:MAG: hypothetical protein QOE32_7269, partial [Pseudonocardiales bacterium]|nr:hypothetical protein [Pseudonocardiales bacterium]
STSQPRLATPEVSAPTPVPGQIALSSIIASDITQGPTTVTIKPTDGAFHTSGCQPWTKVN